MVTKTKKQAKPASTKTNYVIVTPELQQTNAEVKKAYEQIVEAAKQLMQKFEMKKYRTYAQVDNTKDPQQTNYLAEFVCHFWSISLSNSKEGKSYIWIYYDADYIEKFGSNMTNQLLRNAYLHTQSHDGTTGIEYALKINFSDHDVHNYFFRLTFEGETDTISISTVERPEE